MESWGLGIDWSNTQSENENTQPEVGRRVRIVSANNTYHGKHTSEESGSVYNEQDNNDIVDQYSGNYEENEEERREYNGSSDEEEDQDGEDSDDSNDMMPASLRYLSTPMSAISTSAVSSGSHSRTHDGAAMRHALSMPSLKAEEFEAGLRMHPLYAPDSPDLEPPNMQHRSFSVDDFYRSINEPVPPPRQALPPAARATLSRQGAMSRPKSMMELNHMYAMQSISPPPVPPSSQDMASQRSVASSRESRHSHYFDTVGIPMMPNPSQLSATSGSSEMLSPVSNADTHSTAPTSVHGSAETKPIAIFARPPQLHKARSAQGFRDQIAAHAAQMQQDEYARQLVDASLHSAINDRTAVQNVQVLAKDLKRQSTLLNAGTAGAKRASQLNQLLAPRSSSAAHSNIRSAVDEAEIMGGVHGAQPALRRKPSTAVLEQASKGKARVELDLTLASALVVEGGTLRGKMEVTVKKEKKEEDEVWLGPVKARIVGFEELTGNDEIRHVFYHHSFEISSLPTSSGEGAPLPCYASAGDSEGFHRGKVGTHAFPFAMNLPVGRGAKGSLKTKAGTVKYIVIGSIKLKSRSGADRSIAHFYRDIDVFPYLDPRVVLAPSVTPVEADSSKALFMGGSGKVRLSASLHRSTWVAGQRCYVNIKVTNEGSKKIKDLSLTLVRSITAFKPTALQQSAGSEAASPQIDGGAQPARSHAQTVKKKVAETTLDSGKKAGKGSVTAKGVWTGVDKGEEVEFCHHLLVPPEELSIERGRYLEVSYSLKVSASASLSSDVSVELPLTILNFVSIDPPPGHPGPAALEAVQEVAEKPAKIQIQEAENEARPRGVARMSSMDSLQIQDLNRLYGMPGMARYNSYDSSGLSASPASSSSAMSRVPTSVMSSELESIQEAEEEFGAQGEGEEMPAVARAVIARAKERQLRHAMSLECIGSAIASATARRGGTSRPPMRGPSESVHSDYPSPLPEPCDNLDDMDDEDAVAQRQQYGLSDGVLEYEDSSEDEVDLVLHNKHISELVENRQIRSHRELPPVPASPGRTPLSPGRGVQARAARVPPSPTSVSLRAKTPTSPPALRVSRPLSPAPGVAKVSLDAEADSLSFSLATPASPVKKRQPVPASPSRPKTPSSPNVRAGAVSPRPSPSRPMPASQTRRAVASAVPPVSPTKQIIGSPSSVRTKVAALESAGSPQPRRPASPARRFPPTASLRKPSPSAVSAVSSVSPTAFDWRLNGGNM